MIITKQGKIKEEAGHKMLTRIGNNQRTMKKVCQKCTVKLFFAQISILGNLTNDEKN